MSQILTVIVKPGAAGREAARASEAPCPQSHWPLPPTFHADRTSKRSKAPGKVHRPREMSALPMIDMTHSAGDAGRQSWEPTRGQMGQDSQRQAASQNIHS